MLPVEYTDTSENRAVDRSSESPGTLGMQWPSDTHKSIHKFPTRAESLTASSQRNISRITITEEGDASVNDHAEGYVVVWVLNLLIV